MKRKPICLQVTLAFCSRIHATVRTPMKFTVLMGVLISAVLSGCAKKDPVAGLNELPREATSDLKPVPNFPLLATKIQPEGPAQAPATEPAPPPCPQNASIIFLDAQVTTPITVCTRPDVGAAAESLLFPRGAATTTHKLTDLTSFPGLESQVQPPLVCRVSKGPWSAKVEVLRGCFGTCAPQNTLRVVGVPNNVIFWWTGAIDQHPPGFEFVGRPVKTGGQDLGECHVGTPGS